MKSIKLRKSDLKKPPEDLLRRVGAVVDSRAYPSAVFMAESDYKVLAKNLTKLYRKEFPVRSTKKISYDVGMHLLQFGPNTTVANGVKPGHILVDNDYLRTASESEAALEKARVKGVSYPDPVSNAGLNIQDASGLRHVWKIALGLLIIVLAISLSGCGLLILDGKKARFKTTPSPTCAVSEGESETLITCGDTVVSIPNPADGIDGADGADAHNSIIETSLATTCEHGGTVLTAAIDLNDNSLIDAGDMVTSNIVICNESGDNGNHYGHNRIPHGRRWHRGR